MNQDPNNPTAPSPVIPPEAPINPAAAAAPSLDVAPTPEGTPMEPAMPTAPEAPVMPAAPEAPAMPEAPTLDPSLLQQAIADVPEEAAVTTPEVPSAVPLDNLGNTAEQPVAPAETSPFTGAAPSANFATPEAEAEAEPAPAPTDPTTGTPIATDEANKTTPSVAFNDPAQQPDDVKHAKDIDFSKLIEKIKQRPVIAIIGGGAIIIVILILILAFAI